MLQHILLKLLHYIVNERYNHINTICTFATMVIPQHHPFIDGISISIRLLGYHDVGHPQL